MSLVTALLVRECRGVVPVPMPPTASSSGALVLDLDVRGVLPTLPAVATAPLPGVLVTALSQVAGMGAGTGFVLFVRDTTGVTPSHSPVRLQIAIADAAPLSITGAPLVPESACLVRCQLSMMRSMRVTWSVT
jgi:hypothetical protein